MATRTVGWGFVSPYAAKTYSTIAAAVAAAGAGDTIQVFASNNKGLATWAYDAAVADSVGVTTIGMLPNAGVIAGSVSLSSNSASVFQNLTVYGPISIASGSGTIRIDSCVVTATVAAANHGIFVTGGTHTLTVVNCFFVATGNNCYATAGTVNLVYCTMIGSTRFNIYNGGGATITANNCLVDGGAGGQAEFIGTITGANNATRDGTAPAAGRVMLADAGARWAEIDSSFALPMWMDPRITAASNCAGAGNDQSAVTTVDFFGRTRAAFDIGCSAVWPLPNCPAANLVKDDDTTGVDRTGATITGTLSTAAPLTPSVTIPAPPPVSLLATETTIYTCPANKVATVRVVHLCNTDASGRTITLYKVKVGDSAGDDVVELKTQVLGAVGTASGTYNLGPITLDAGDKLTGLASVASVVTAIAEVYTVAK